MFILTPLPPPPGASREAPASRPRRLRPSRGQGGEGLGWCSAAQPARRGRRAPVVEGSPCRRVRPEPSFRAMRPRGVSRGPGTWFTFAILSSPQGGPHFRHLKAQTMAHFRHLKPKAWPTFAILQAVNIAVNIHIRIDWLC